MFDVSGTFQCDTYGAAGAALAMVSTGVPFGPFEETLPHTLTGDENLVDVDLSVDVYIARDATALIGVRVSPLNTTVTPAPLAMNYARGLWLAVTPRAGDSLDWKLLTGLDFVSFNEPLLTGSLQQFAGGAWATVRIVARGSRVVGSVGPAVGPASGSLRGVAGREQGVAAVGASLLFNVDVSTSAAPNAGFVGVATGDWVPQQAFFRNVQVNALSTTCSGTPPQGAQILTEMCALANGTGFTFVPVDLDHSHDFYSVLYGWDSEDTESGTNMAYVGQACEGNATLECFFAACSSNSTQNSSANKCAGFNQNGWPKGNWNDVGPTELTTLFVKNEPSGFIQLTANPALCIEAVDVPEKPVILLLNPCLASNARQLWTVEKSIGDNNWLIGPIRNAGNGGVMDVNFLSDGITAGKVDAPINTYGYHGSSNQLWNIEGGMIRSTQLGSLCLGSCSTL